MKRRVSPQKNTVNLILDFKSTANIANDIEIHKACFARTGFLGQFRQMSSQFNHCAILFRAKLNAADNGHSISFYD